MEPCENTKSARATRYSSLTSKIFVPEVRDVPMSKVLESSRHNIVSGRKEESITQRCSILTILSPDSRTVEEAIESSIPDEFDHETKRNLSGCLVLPYYRTRRSKNGDGVLVKDACVSCSLLVPENSTIFEKQSSKQYTLSENKFVKQLRSECKDLAAITRKFSSYTRDILSGIARKTRRGNSTRTVVDGNRGAVMRPVALQYYDEFGQPCLKLRLRESSGSMSDSLSSNIHVTQLRPLMDFTGSTGPQIRTIFPDRYSSFSDENSTICSGSSYDSSIEDVTSTGAIKKSRS